MRRKDRVLQKGPEGVALQRITSATIVLLAIAFLANAQTQNGTIKGVVKDFSNNVIPGVEVSLTNIDTRQVYKMMTNETGEYRFQVPLGVYTLDTNLPGFEPLHRTDLKVNAGETLSQQLKLTIAIHHPLHELFHLIS